MIRMKAIRNLTYRTRRLLADGTSEPTSSLKPGDIFEVMKPRDLKLLRATRKAEVMREPAKVPAPPSAVAEKIAAAVASVAPPTPPAPTTVGAMTTAQAPNAPQPATDDRAALRTEYEKVLGKAPFPGWSSDVLREKIAAAQASS